MKLRRLLILAGLLAGLAVPFAGARADGYVPADDGARITGQTRVNDSTLDMTVYSPAADQTVNVRVLLPQGWRPDAARTWPVVFAYGGGGADDDHTTWTERTEIEDVAASWDVIVVTADAAQLAGYTNWYNYGRGGVPAWETFHAVEMRQLVERNLRGGDQRAAIGISSGGNGAMTIAAHHPGLFKFAAAYSSILHILMPGVPTQIMLLNTIGGVDPNRVYGIPGLDNANWRANNPYDLADRLRGVGLYVSSGTTGDRGPLDPTDMTLLEAIRARIVGGLSEQVTGATSRAFTDRLRALNIPAEVNLYGDGWHQWAYWNREMKRSWPLVMNAIGARQHGG